jgi:hypothetical protein
VKQENNQSSAGSKGTLLPQPAMISKVEQSLPKDSGHAVDDITRGPPVTTGNLFIMLNKALNKNLI